MPRTLPWEKKGAPATVTRPRRPASVSSTTQRLPRVQSAIPVVEKQGGSYFRKDPAASSELPTSSSPPPEAPEESLMIEGFDHDDKFRMVEDEFLTIAQSFTAHLHAAEYKRQQKMVKSRNADTISSISRPVSGKMPDHTRRKVEGVARSKKQRTAVEGLFGKKNQDGGISDDSDDGVGLPYIGTTLHGLMDSPRKKAASISKAVHIGATTRAAAGFNKPATNSKLVKKQALRSPQPRSSVHLTNVTGNVGSETSDGDDDDDLDAPIPAPKLMPLDRKPSMTAEALSKSKPVVITQTSNSFPIPRSSSPATSMSKTAPSSLSFDDIPEFLAQAGARPSRRRAHHFSSKNNDQSRQNRS